MVCIPGSNVSDGGLIMPALEKARLFVMMRHILVRGITTVSHLLLQIKMLSLFSRFWRNCFLLWQVNSSKWTVDGGSKHLTCGWDKDSRPSDTMPLSNCTSDYCYFLFSFYLFCFIYYLKYFNATPVTVWTHQFLQIWLPLFTPMLTFSGDQRQVSLPSCYSE